MKLQTCYMCTSVATSKEHVPPKTIFPEIKDSDGLNYREKLITVPSCDVHNNGKSSDDEFLLVSLAGIIGNNSIGYRHKFTKVDRALRRTSYKLLKKVFVSDVRLETVELGDNKFIEILWGTPDQKRLSHCFDRIARGIYWHHFGQMFSGATKPLLGFVSPNDKNAKTLHQFLVDRAKIDLENLQKHGENQDVFYYQITPPDQFGLLLLHFVFYGGLSIYVALSPDTSNPPANLAYELMNLGIKTIFTLGERKYEVDFGEGT